MIYRIPFFYYWGIVSCSPLCKPQVLADAKAGLTDAQSILFNNRHTIDSVLFLLDFIRLVGGKSSSIPVSRSNKYEAIAV